MHVAVGPLLIHVVVAQLRHQLRLLQLRRQHRLRTTQSALRMVTAKAELAPRLISTLAAKALASPHLASLQETNVVSVNSARPNYAKIAEAGDESKRAFAERSSRTMRIVAKPNLLVRVACVHILTHTPRSANQRMVSKFRFRIR